MIDVCICTHSPNREILNESLLAVAGQTASPDQFRVFIIDNLNDPPIRANDPLFAPLQKKKITLKIFRETQLGIAHARVRALRESDADAVLFVDDDNILDPDFVKYAHAILDYNHEVGCFSGKISTPTDLDVPPWIRPLLGSLAIRDEGDKPIVDWFRNKWAKWVPACTASMVLRKEVAQKFLETHASRPEFFEFGRRGRNHLMSGEDYLMALSAADAGFKCGYFPKLKMEHRIRADRLSFGYMARLMSSFAKTDLKRETYLGLPPEPFQPLELKSRLLANAMKGKDARARICYWLYEIIYVSGRTYRLARRGDPIVKELGGA